MSRRSLRLADALARGLAGNRRLLSPEGRIVHGHATQITAMHMMMVGRHYREAFGSAPPYWIHALDAITARKAMASAIASEVPLPAEPPAAPLPFHALSEDYPFPNPDTRLPAPGTGERRLVLNIPHSATAIPPNTRAALLLDDAALADELRVMTDWFTDDLFPVTPWEAERIVSPVSRLVVDAERFPDDRDEAMALAGMGAIYTHTHHGRRLRWAPGEAERRALMAAYYWPHHDRLTYAVGRVVQAFGRAVIVDCHSFSSMPLPHEPSQGRDRPDICIGTVAGHAPVALVDALSNTLRGSGLSVDVNRPFAGSILPPAFRGDDRVVTVMIEVKRKLYMDEATGERRPRFCEVQAIMAGLLATAAQHG